MKEQKQEETETPQITFEAAAAGCGTSGIYRFYHGTYYLGWYLGTLSAVSFLLSPTAVSLRLSAHVLHSLGSHPCLSYDQEGEKKKGGDNKWDEESRVPEKYFWAPHVKLFNLDPPDRGGGVSDTVPSPKRHTKFYIKPNTGDHRELSPPVLYKTKHRGR